MNKKILSYALAAALMLPISSASVKAMPLIQQTKVAGAEKGTQFFKGTFAQALAKAKKENKKLMVDCYTLWCGPCRFMATNVFPNDTLGAYMNEHFFLKSTYLYRKPDGKHLHQHPVENK